MIGILNTFFNNKKIKAISDTADLIEHAVYSGAVEENSALLQTILRWNQNNKSKKFTHKTKVGGPSGLFVCNYMSLNMWSSFVILHFVNFKTKISNDNFSFTFDILSTASYFT